MKKILLSTVVALASATAINAQTILHTQDFETEEVAEVTTGEWRISANGVRGYNDLNKISVEQDATHGKYVKIFPRNRGNAGAGYYGFGTNSALNRWPAQADRLGMEGAGITQYTVEFDAAIKASAYVSNDGGTLRLHGANAQIAVSSSSTIAGSKGRVDYGFTNYNGDNSFQNVFFAKMVGTKETSFEGEADPWDGADFSFTNEDELGKNTISVPVDGTWSHYKFDVDITGMKVSYTITPEGGSAITGSYESLADALYLSGIYFLASCGSAEDYITLDNIKVTTSGTTGVAGVAAEQTKADGAIYNLAGQTVKNATKGIYIQNGKKFVVK